jgi:hypothetical protein
MQEMDDRVSMSAGFYKNQAGFLVSIGFGKE